MLSRTYETTFGQSAPSHSEGGQYETPETESAPEAVPNWIGMAVVGVLLMIIGVFIATESGTIGGGIIFIGFLMLGGARMVWKWESDDQIFSDLDYDWASEVASDEVEDDFRYIEDSRKKEIEEIVKAVKATIRVRCRYCGTLNDEKANKCESCGANL